MKKIIITALSILFSLTTVFSQQYPGYTLYATMGGTTAYLIDTNSNVYHSWTFPGTAQTGYSTYMLPGGTLLRTVSKSGNSFTGGPICGQVQKVDWDGTVIWDYVYSTTNYCTHHDICPMPNGNVLLISYERKTAAEATAAGSTVNIEMWPDKIVEVQPTGATTGTVVWEWHAWDHLSQNVDNTKANYQTSISAHPELLNINYKTAKDWMHMNGVDYNSQLDQITFSSHNLNEIYVIDHSTTTAQAAGHTGGNSGKGGDILYRWGNPAAYSAGTTANQVINVVHDAHWIPQGCPKAGYLVAFNNKGISTPSSKSTIDLVNAPVSGYNYTLSGTAYTPASFDWRHATNYYTSNMGGSQQFPNGNMLITIALSGTMYEIDSNQNILWTKTVSGSVPKAKRYGICYITGGPDTAVITKTGNALISSIASGNQWYLNGSIIAGATSQTYTPSASGNYTVQVTDSNGCTSQMSAIFNFSVTGIHEINLSSEVVLYPNPSSGIITIITPASLRNFEVLVFDAFGKLLQQHADVKTVNLSMYQNGVYYIAVKSEGITANKKITLIR